MPSENSRQNGSRRHEDGGHGSQNSTSVHNENVGVKGQVEILGNNVTHIYHTLSPSSENSVPKYRRVSFHLKPQVERFYEKPRCIDDLHWKIKCNYTNTRPGLLPIFCIHGLPGIGKSEMVKRYAHTFTKNDFYTHVVWINAESEEAMRTDFRNLADDVGVRLTYRDGGRKSEETVLQNVYEQLCSEATLVVFDGANNGGGSVEHYVSQLKKYLPMVVVAGQTYPHVLITSRHDSFGIEYERCELLEGFMHEHAVGYLRQCGMITYERYIKNAEQLNELLCGLPFALHFATGRILEARKSTEWWSTTINKFMTGFRERLGETNGLRFYDYFVQHRHLLTFNPPDRHRLPTILKSIRSIRDEIHRGRLSYANLMARETAVENRAANALLTMDQLDIINSTCKTNVLTQLTSQLDSNFIKVAIIVNHLSKLLDNDYVTVRERVQRENSHLKESEVGKALKVFLDKTETITSTTIWSTSTIQKIIDESEQMSIDGFSQVIQDSPETLLTLKQSIEKEKRMILSKINEMRIKTLRDVLSEITQNCNQSINVMKQRGVILAETMQRFVEKLTSDLHSNFEKAIERVDASRANPEVREMEKEMEETVDGALRVLAEENCNKIEGLKAELEEGIKEALEGFHADALGIIEQTEDNGDWFERVMERQEEIEEGVLKKWREMKIFDVRLLRPFQSKLSGSLQNEVDEIASFVDNSERLEKEECDKAIKGCLREYANILKVFQSGTIEPAEFDMKMNALIKMVRSECEEKLREKRPLNKSLYLSLFDEQVEGMNVTFFDQNRVNVGLSREAQYNLWREVQNNYSERMKVARQSCDSIDSLTVEHDRNLAEALALIKGERRREQIGGMLNKEFEYCKELFEISEECKNKFGRNMREAVEMKCEGIDQVGDDDELKGTMEKCLEELETICQLNAVEADVVPQGGGGDVEERGKMEANGAIELLMSESFEKIKNRMEKTH